MLNWLKSVWCRLTGRVPVAVSESAKCEHTGLDWCNADTSIETLPVPYTLNDVDTVGNVLMCRGYYWTLPAWRMPYIRDGLKTLRERGSVAIPNDLMVLLSDQCLEQPTRYSIHDMLCQIQGITVDGCSVSLNR